MSAAKWVAFFVYCNMNLVIGINYFNIYPNIAVLSDFFNDLTSNFQVIYPLLFLVLSPISYNIIWNYFKLSVCLSWTCILISLWINYLKTDNFALNSLSHFAIVFSTSVSIQGNSVLAVQVFEKREYFTVLNWTSSFHMIGMTCGYLIREWLDFSVIYLSLGIYSSLIFLFFLVFLKWTAVKKDSKYIGFFSALNELINTSDDGILFLTLSCYIGFIYCSVLDISNLLYALLKGRQHYINIHMTVFLITSVFGGVISVASLKFFNSFGVLVRVYLGIPFLLLFLLNFVFRGPFFNYFLVVLSGLTCIATIPYLQIIMLSVQKDRTQPISINISYCIGFVFMCLILFISRVFYVYLETRASMFYNVVQLLLLVVFFTVYNHRIKKKFIGIRRKKSNQQVLLGSKSKSLGR